MIRLKALLCGLALAASFGAASPSLAQCKVGPFAVLKTTMRGPRALVDVKINDHDAQMIVDSGAFYSTLSPGVAAEFGLRLEGTPVQMRGIGGATATSLTTVKNLVLDGIPLHQIQFIVAGSETGTAGLLGQNVLGLADVEYDLKHGAVRLMKSQGCSNAVLAYWAPPEQVVNTIDIEARDPPYRTHTIGSATINGVKIKVIFDTGAARSMITLAAAKRVGITPDGPGVQEAGVGRGVGKKVVRSWIAPIASFKLGDEEVKNTRLRISDTELGDGDMLLGADFFLSHRVYVANSHQKLYFTYEGGPIFNAEPPRVIDATGAEVALKKTDDDEPTDAAGYGRRAAAEASLRQYDQSIADFGKAIALAPNDFRYPFQRAMAHLGNNEPLLARVDLDTAITLSPNAPEPRIQRARLLLRSRLREQAFADLTATDKLLARQADSRLTLASLFAEAGDRNSAIAQLDLWIPAHPEDSHRADALNDRCWARALEGRELQVAFDDCRTALRLRPDTPNFLNSRGLIELRFGELDKAIADYDAVIARQPHNAWALYGRGIARLHKGQKAESDADLAEAAKENPTIADRAKRLGIQ